MATWFVTGAARGLGYEIALRALEAGANVVATARDLSLVETALGSLRPSDDPRYDNRQPRRWRLRAKARPC